TGGVGGGTLGPRAREDRRHWGATVTMGDDARIRAQRRDEPRCVSADRALWDSRSWGDLDRGADREGARGQRRGGGERRAPCTRARPGGRGGGGLDGRAGFRGAGPAKPLTRHRDLERADELLRR